MLAMAVAVAVAAAVVVVVVVVDDASQRCLLSWYLPLLTSLASCSCGRLNACCGAGDDRNVGVVFVLATASAVAAKGSRARYQDRDYKS